LIARSIPNKWQEPGTEHTTGQQCRDRPWALMCDGPVPFFLADPDNYHNRRGDNHRCACGYYEQQDAHDDHRMILFKPWFPSPMRSTGNAVDWISIA
jgi:hypothetical protein